MTNDRTILITGVTGNQGCAVAQTLQGSGFRLRGLTRKPESEREEAQGKRLAGKAIAFGTERLHHYMELQDRFFNFQKYG
jgi:nucleoside-diphosphate-sugar epimerase